MSVHIMIFAPKLCLDMCING